MVNYGCLSQTKKSGVCGPTAIMCVSWLGGWASKRFFFTHCDMVRFDGDLRDMYTVYVHNMYMYTYMDILYIYTYLCIYIHMDHQQYDIGFLVNMVIPCNTPIDGNLQMLPKRWINKSWCIYLR